VVLRSILVTKIREETEGCKKFHIEEHCDIFSSEIIFRIFRSRRKEGAGNVASVEKTKTY